MVEYQILASSGFKVRLLLSALCFFFSGNILHSDLGFDGFDRLVEMAEASNSEAREFGELLRTVRCVHAWDGTRPYKQEHRKHDSKSNRRTSNSRPTRAALCLPFVEQKPGDHQVSLSVALPQRPRSLTHFVLPFKTSIIRHIII
jgi:hypothetical protein